MSKLTLSMLASLLTFSSLSAVWPLDFSLPIKPVDLSLELGAGYKRGNFQFQTVADLNHSITQSRSKSYYYDDYNSDNSESIIPVYTSILDWKDLNIGYIEGRGNCVICNMLYLRGAANYGWICNGTNIDNDYLYTDQSRTRKELISKSTSQSKGFVYDMNIAAGYQLSFLCGTISVAPLIGYSWIGQYFHDTHLHQNEILDYSGDLYSLGSGSRGLSISGLHSKYDARWNSPFAGFDSEFQLCDWTFMFNYEYHWGCYHAKAHWNLRSDMPNGFRHHSKNSYGHVIDAGIKYDFCQWWTIALHGGFQYFRANHGKDVTIFEPDSYNHYTINTIELKKVQWHAYNVSLDIGLAF